MLTRFALAVLALRVVGSFLVRRHGDRCNALGQPFFLIKVTRLLPEVMVEAKRPVSMDLDQVCYRVAKDWRRLHHHRKVFARDEEQLHFIDGDREFLTVFVGQQLELTKTVALSVGAIHASRAFRLELNVTLFNEVNAVRYLAWLKDRFPCLQPPSIGVRYQAHQIRGGQ